MNAAAKQSQCYEIRSVAFQGPMWKMASYYRNNGPFYHPRESRPSWTETENESLCGWRRCGEEWIFTSNSVPFHLDICHRQCKESSLTCIKQGKTLQRKAKQLGACVLGTGFISVSFEFQKQNDITAEDCKDVRIIWIKWGYAFEVFTLHPKASSSVNHEMQLHPQGLTSCM